MANLDESTRSQTKFKNTRKNHDSCPSLPTFQIGAGSINDPSVEATSNCDEQATALCDKCLKDNNVQYQNEFYLNMAQMLPDFNQMGAASMSSITSEDNDIFDSLVVTRRRRGNLFDPTPEQESSDEDETSDNALQSNVIEKN